ncbi:MAG TPA: hypothetical protein VFU02_18020 [Polyangiaceae bacterium]|nr:hypothetical protein [Polyangiaceae bacterium]
MSVKGQTTVSSWLKVAPSTFRELQSFDSRPAHEKRAMLEGWVAWLNQTGAQDPATLTFSKRLSQLLQDFDQDQKGPVDRPQLQQWLDTWLETAGQVGGPERDQDPTMPHPTGWHSHRTEDDR